MDLLRNPRMALTGDNKVTPCGTSEDSDELSPGQQCPIAHKKFLAGCFQAGIDGVDEIETKSTAKARKCLSRDVRRHRDLGRDQSTGHRQPVASRFTEGMLTRIACHRG